MSWHTSAIFLNSHCGKGAVSCFSYLGLPGARFVRNISFDDAASNRIEGRAIAVVDRWTVVFDPLMFMTLANAQGVSSEGIWPVVLESRLRGLSNKWEIVSILLEGSSGSYGFARFAGGAQVRCFLRQSGQSIIDLGAPSEAERQAFADHADEEAAVLTLAQGLTVSLAELSAAEFSLYEFDEKSIRDLHGN
jgi:hypothetical protein